MDYTSSVSGNAVSLKLSGQFTFADTQKFKEILDIVTGKKAKSLSLDFLNVTFIDSSGMGMLLLLRDEAQNNSISLNLLSPQGQVEKLFNISKFYKIFSIG